ncbi:hypothetical protein L1987_45833 [Smallanthus sonchifolius]|uniref:Uncharacterized protein n=1 Tax=Smallanthus sonchifolius TaxID=185202 RepID=A0ACB9FXV9_9ASTR|nr:hypothetical protein L1987_45833 [Smallanthus sonchifolius]
MANMVQVTNMFNYDNEIGTSQKPPKLLNLADYSNWKDRFDQFVSFTDTSLWILILEGYTHPTYSWMGQDNVPKPVSALTTEEKLLFDREKKAMASISMSFLKEIYHSFKQFKPSQQLWEALQKWCEGRFYHLLSELASASVVYETEKINDKFLEALPSKSSSGSHLNQKVADEYLAMFSSSMASYENFIGGKIHDPEVIEEDFIQIDPVDLEEMNIQWNMAIMVTLLRSV